MAKCTLRNNTTIGDYMTPYIVAEVNSSHNGNIDTAKEMIDAAKQSGCSCVKFQSWSAQTLYSKTFYNANPISKRMVTKFSFDPSQLRELAQHCDEVGIDFSSTPYSRDEVDFLIDQCNVPFVKIASMELNNHPLLEYISSKGVPMILSTGMGDMDEIRRAVETIESTGNTQLCLLHCVSIYPSILSDVSLLNVVGLREAYPHYPIGFSDHSTGIEISIAAAALGSAVIEKHMTLNREKIGMDNQMATEPDQLKLMVDSCNNVNIALGTKVRAVLPEEIQQRKKMRRSIVVSVDKSAGDVLSLSDLDAKRPGDGLSPEEMPRLVGRKLVRDIEADEIITMDDIE